MHPSVNEIGAYIKVVKGTPPGHIAAGVVNGAAIDRLEHGSCVLKVSTGSETGAPSARSVAAQIEDSADGSTGWAAFNPGAAGTGLVTVAAVNSEGEKNIDLSGAKRYIRPAVTTAFTAGTAPTLGQAVEIVLGGSRSRPVI